MAAVTNGNAGRADQIDLAAWLRAQEKKDLLRFVTIGSVDDGKSTLIGRLLHDAHGLYQDQLDAVRRASVKGSTRGGGSTSEIDFSLFTDGLLAEREQGITIDVAYRYFSTARRKFIIADTPGHVQYTRNMATGASTADVAVILVDARLGVIAQTRRHAHIAALLGIPHVVACVNKMDLVDFDRARFDTIAQELEGIAKRLGIGQLHPLPVSALAGDNVVTPSARTPWWTGTTLLDMLETLPVAVSDDAKAFRLPVQLVLRPSLAYRGFAGQIASGTIAPGDEIVALPSGKRTRVAGVDVGGREVASASAPMSVSIRLTDEIDVSRGDMLVRAADLPRTASELEAHLVWMSERALDPGKTYLLKHTTRTVRAAIEVIHGTDPETLEARPAEILALNDIGRVRVHCRAPLFFDPYRKNRITGAFILIDSVTNDTVAAGMIEETSKSAARPETGSATQVGAAERRERLGQRGLDVRVLASTLESARDLAFALERALFDRGRVATVVDGGDAAAACARAGLIALHAATGESIALVIDGGDPVTVKDEPSLSEKWAELLEARSS
jgi:sulfate adenylyltransferase large subunit